MPDIHGIFVELRTSEPGAAVSPGTDDHVYVGVFGKGGGSEFPLDVKGFDDFESGLVKYYLGDVWDGSVLAGAPDARSPFESTRGMPGRPSLGHGNDPQFRYIDIDKVDYVYLRKHSHKGKDDDDRWRMESVRVSLYGPHAPSRRVFTKTNALWLANEYGLQVWLVENE